MVHLHWRSFLVATSLFMVAGNAAAAQQHKPVVRASIHDQDGDANFPSILTDISLTTQTEAQAAVEREVAALISDLREKGLVEG